MRFTYPVTLEAEPEGGFTVTFEDVPGAITFGQDRAEALSHAAGALISMLSAMVDAGQALPAPSPGRGRPLVTVTAIEAVKLALNEAMRTRGMSNTAMAAALCSDEKAIRRLRDVLQPSKMSELERALAALGKRVVLEVRNAAA